MARKERVPEPEDFVYRYALEVQVQAAGEHSRVTEMFRAILAEILDLVSLYDQEGREMAPRQFAMVPDGKPLDIWPGDRRGRAMGAGY